MSYVDGFVLAVKTDRLEEYRKIARTAAEVWKDHGALGYVEATADDIDMDGFYPFTRTIDAAPDETVVFAWIRYPSREARDAINAKVMADPRLKESMESADMPFDCARIAYGGFTVLVEG